SHASNTRRFEISNDFTFGSGLPVGSSPVTGVDLRSTWPARPLGSSPITGPSRLLRAVPPLCLAVLCPSRCPPLGVLPLATRGPTSPAPPGHRYRDDRFSSSVPAPAASSRHLYTGHRQGHEQAAPRLRARLQARLCPKDESRSSVLMPSECLSMRQQWFAHARLLVAHLTRSRRPFPRNAPPPGFYPAQLPVVWAPRL